MASTPRSLLCSAGGFRSDVKRMVGDSGWVLGKAFPALVQPWNRSPERCEGISILESLQNLARQSQSQKPGLVLLLPLL